MRLPHLRLPTITRPHLKMPTAPRTPSLTLPRLPQRKRPSFSLPSIDAGSRFPALGRFASRVTSRDFWTLRRVDEAGQERDYTRFAVVLAGLSLVALAATAVIVLASLVSGGSSEGPGGPFSISPTTSSPADTPAPSGPTEAVWIDAQMLEDDPLAAATILRNTALATGATEFVAAANHIRQASVLGRALNEDFLCPLLDHFNVDYASGPAGAPACGGAIVQPPPDIDVSLGLWANDLSAWEFDGLPEGAASYNEGDEAPFILSSAAEPDEEYTIAITYACRAGGVPAIDFISGVPAADAEIFAANGGPGEKLPGAAVPLLNTPDLDVREGGIPLLYLYGGHFLLLPQGPGPAAECEDEQTITVPVQADADEIVLMGSVKLADADDHDGQGASDATASISLSASVSSVGTATAAFEPGVIAP